MEEKKSETKPLATIKKNFVVAESKKTAVEVDKTAAAKAESAKTPVKKAAPAKKPAAKKAAPATKTAPVKKAAAKEIEVSAFLQYGDDKSVSYSDLVENAKNVWKFDLGKKVEDIKKLALYVKPEENRVYYVVNDSETGSFDM